MKGHVQRLVGTIVLTVAGAAMFVGTAYAEPEYQAGVRLRADAGSSSVAGPDWFERTAARGPATVSLAPVPEVSDRPGQGGVQSVAPVPEVSERPGQGGVGAVSLAPVPDWFERTAARGNPAEVSLAPVPEVSERPGQGGVQSVAPVPEVSERLGQGGMTAVEAPAATAAGESFAWGDALMGAGSALGLVLMLGGAVALTLRHRGGMIPH